MFLGQKVNSVPHLGNHLECMYTTPVRCIFEGKVTLKVVY